MLMVMIMIIKMMIMMMTTQIYEKNWKKFTDSSCSLQDAVEDLRIVGEVLKDYSKESTDPSYVQQTKISKDRPNPQSPAKP